jgi:hypothetical protein
MIQRAIRTGSPCQTQSQRSRIKQPHKTARKQPGTIQCTWTHTSRAASLYRQCTADPEPTTQPEQAAQDEQRALFAS